MIYEPNMTPQPAKADPSLLLKTDRDKLVDAEKKIAELELGFRNAAETAEKLKWQAAQLRVAITAIATHYNCPPDEAKKIVDDYIADQEKKYAELAEEAKKEFVERLKRGEVPELRVNNAEAAAESPIPFKKG